MQNLRKDIMSLIINSVLTLTLIISIITEVKKIKSNKEVLKAYNKICENHQELKNKLEERNKINKESQEEIIKLKEYYKELKNNLSIDYDYLTEEVIKRINSEIGKRVV